MKDKTKIGIIICNRYHTCAGGKCLRSLKGREGAFSIYGNDEEVELVGYTTCGGCPGGNIEYTPEEMIKNGVQVIHLATGLVVGYPPCPHISDFKNFIEGKYGLKVIGDQIKIIFENEKLNREEEKRISKHLFDHLIKIGKLEFNIVYRAMFSKNNFLIA